MLSEKQRKRIVETIQNPKNSKKSLKTILESDLWTSWRKSTLSDKEFDTEQRLVNLYTSISKRLYSELKQLPPEKMAEFAEKWGIKGGLDKTGYLDPMFETDVLMVCAGGNEEVWSAIAQLYREGYLTPPEKLEVKKLRETLRKSLKIQGALWIDNVAKLREGEYNLNENKNMKKFNYREYIQDNWLLKEAKGQPATTADLKGFATKDSTLNREKRAKEGNWQGSIGKYVEAHGAEINAAASSHQLRNFVVNTMKPTLGPEAQEYLDNLLANCNSDRRLLQALYNVALKGNGMGLHESGFDEEGQNLDSEYEDDLVDRICDLLPNSITDSLMFDIGELYDHVRQNKDKFTGNLESDAKTLAASFSNNDDYWKGPFREGLTKEELSPSYPKAEAWLQQHPEIKVYTSVSDIADPSEFEDLETDLVEAGYMFISELEAALEGQNYGIEDDEDLLASCERGVINDPDYNPPVSSFNY